jgi:redox-sensitive bicupin YhaK (pirin superfamily)
VSGLEQRIVLAPDDGSLGPLLRVADDRLAPGAGYGGHAHRAVDVVAVVLSGSLRHRWGDGAELRAGDVAVLRSGTGLDHDEVAGEDGARVLQCYLRAAEPEALPRHEVIAGPTGWIDLGRDDARLWLGPAGEGSEVPGALRLAVTGDCTEVAAGSPPADATLLVWQLDGGRPAWARD